MKKLPSLNLFLLQTILISLYLELSLSFSTIPQAKEILLATLAQWFTKKLCFGEKNSHNRRKCLSEKNFHNNRKVVTTKTQFSQQEKSLTTKKGFSHQEKSSHNKIIFTAKYKKILTTKQKKILIAKEKLSQRNKITILAVEEKSKTAVINNTIFILLD